MILFREHRGTFKESLETKKEFNTVKDFSEWLKVGFPTYAEFEIAKCWYDERLNAETSIITSGKAVLGFMWEAPVI